MLLKVLLTLCSVLALCSAFPWTHSNAHHHEGNVARIATPTTRSQTCQTVSDSALPAISDGSTVVRVCNFDNLCVVPDLNPCCATPAITQERRASNSSIDVTIGSSSVSVRFYIERAGGCYTARTSGGAVSACTNAPLGSPCNPCSTVTENTCSFGMAEDVCDDGVCVCSPGFIGDGCCECNLTAGFFRPVGTQECLPCECCTIGTVLGLDTCQATGECNCREGYTGDKCCDCDEGFVRPPGTEECLPCACCPVGTVGGAEECDDNGNCECREGYTGDGCCVCDSGFYRPPDSDQCLPCNCCTEGTVGGVDTCDSSGRCTCQTGYTGDRCCQCEPGFFRPPGTRECRPCDNDCCPEGTVGGNSTCGPDGLCTCLEGFTGPGCCECNEEFFRPPGTRECNPCEDECCPEGTVGGSRTCGPDGLCTCLEGFAGPGCCECEDGYFRPPGTTECRPCMCCRDGTDDGSITCNATGNCGACRSGFSGPKCCDTCSCCGEGTVTGSNECNANMECDCAAGFSGPRCCINNRIYTDIYFIMDTTGSFQPNDACPIQFALMQVLAGMQGRSGLENFRYAFMKYPAVPSTTEDLFINELPNNNNECSYIQELVDDWYGLAGNARNEETLIVRGRFPAPRHDIVLQSLKTSVDSNVGVTRRSVAVLVTGGRYLLSNALRGNVLTSSILREIKDISNLHIIAIGLSGQTDDEADLENDIQNIATVRESAFLLDFPPSTTEIVETILNRFEAINILGSSSRPTASQILATYPDFEETFQQGNSGFQTRAVAYCNCRNIISGSTTADTCLTPTNGVPTCIVDDDSAKMANHALFDEQDELERGILSAVEKVLAHHQG